MIDRLFKHVVIAALLAIIYAFISYVQPHTTSDPKIILHHGDLVVAEGDSLTYGQDYSATGRPVTKPVNGSMNNRSIAPYPETLQEILGNRVTVLNHGFPGDRTTEGLSRWEKAESGKLAIIMYGTNDCWNFGGYASGRLSIEKFKKSLREIVERRQKAGAQVILMTPPPLQEPGKDVGLTLYRNAVTEIANETHALLEDTARDLAGVKNIWSDGTVHLSPESHRKIAESIAAHIQVE